MNQNLLRSLQAYAAGSSLAQQDSFVFPRKEFERVIVRSQQLEGGTALDTLKILPLNDEDETTVDVAAVATDLAIKLKGDDDGKLGGYTVLATDFLIVLTDKGWQLLDITTVAADAGADQIDITAMTGMDGVTGLLGDVAKGNPCYIARTANILTRDIGVLAFSLDFPDAGVLSNPLAIFFDSQGANEHSVSGTFGYEKPLG